MRVSAVITIAMLLAAGQAKPVISFDAILRCVSAQNCQNMTASQTNWYDVVPDRHVTGA